MTDEQAAHDDAAKAGAHDPAVACMAAEAFIGSMTDAFATAVRQAVAEQATTGLPGRRFRDSMAGQHDGWRRTSSSLETYGLVLPVVVAVVFGGGALLLTRSDDAAAAGRRTERVRQLTMMAQHVLGKDADTDHWIDTPHPMLGGVSPRGLAESELGAEKVERLLYGLAGLPGRA